MKPGIHSISSDQYHAASGVSRSMLEWIAPPKKPVHFKAKYIDKLIPDEDTPALQFGSLLHRCVLESESTDGAFHVKPKGMKFNTKAGIEWKDEHSDRTIITAEDEAMIKGIRESLRRHPAAMEVLEDCDCERSAFVVENGLLLKARFDVLPRKKNAIADLKTCESADLDSVEKAMLNYGYYRQAAFYLKVADLLGLKRTYFKFIFVEKTPPYAVCCYTPIDVILEAGRLAINRDLALLRQCYAENRWPGYPEKDQGCGVPAWAMKKLEEIL